MILKDVFVQTHVFLSSNSELKVTCKCERLKNKESSWENEDAHAVWTCCVLHNNCATLRVSSPFVCIDSCDNRAFLSSGYISEHNLPEKLHRAGGKPNREGELHRGDKHARRPGEHHHRSGRHRRPHAGQRAQRARPRRHGNRASAALVLRRIQIIAARSRVLSSCTATYPQTHSRTELHTVWSFHQNARENALALK